MSPDDRIALTGRNGGGKSSLIRYILKILDMPRDRLTYIPQEIDQRSSKEIMSRALELSGERLGKMMAVVSRLGSRPHRLLESRQPSPGETRKLLLATGIANEPYLIVMDEPTNHMDLPSIECLEKALEGCPCGLLLVSHDRRFLEKLTDRRWHISHEEESSNDFLLQVI
jgi:ATPase subunit of ABC transporter with duplicated ATPase domains